MKTKIDIDQTPSYSIGQDMLYLGLKVGDFFENIGVGKYIEFIKNKIKNLIPKK